MINLFPKEEVFFKLFEGQVEKLKRGIEVLERVLFKQKDLKELSKEMKKLEEADGIGHQLIFHLETSFITPFKRY